MATIKLKGGAARNFFAAMLVDEHGEGAKEFVCGEMLAAVERELAERATATEPKE